MDHLVGGLLSPAWERKVYDEVIRHKAGALVGTVARVGDTGEMGLTALDRTAGKALPVGSMHKSESGPRANSFTSEHMPKVVENRNSCIWAPILAALFLIAKKQLSAH